MTDQTICLEPSESEVILHIPPGLESTVLEYLERRGADVDEITDNKKEIIVECHESVEKTTQLLTDYWLTMDRHCIISSEGSQANPEILHITPTENIPPPED